MEQPYLSDMREVAQQNRKLAQGMDPAHLTERRRFPQDAKNYNHMRYSKEGHLSRQYMRDNATGGVSQSFNDSYKVSR